MVDLPGNEEKVDSVFARPDVLQIWIAVRIVVYAFWTVNDVVEDPVSKFAWEVKQLECAGPLG